MNKPIMIRIFWALMATNMMLTICSYAVYSQDPETSRALFCASMLFSLTTACWFVVWVYNEYEVSSLSRSC